MISALATWTADHIGEQPLRMGQACKDGPEYDGISCSCKPVKPPFPSQLLFLFFYSSSHHAKCLDHMEFNYLQTSQLFFNTESLQKGKERNKETKEIKTGSCSIAVPAHRRQRSPGGSQVDAPSRCQGQPPKRPVEEAHGPWRQLTCDSPRMTPHQTNLLINFQRCSLQATARSASK
jgi:hypothetical protein